MVAATLPDESVRLASPLMPMITLKRSFVPLVGLALLTDAVAIPVLITHLYDFRLTALWEDGVEDYTWSGSLLDVLVVALVRFMLCATYWSCTIPRVGTCSLVVSSLVMGIVKAATFSNPTNVEIAIITLTCVSPLILCLCLWFTASELQDDDVMLVPSLNQLYREWKSDLVSDELTSFKTEPTESSHLLGHSINGNGDVQGSERFNRQLTRMSSLSQLLQYCRPDMGLLAMGLLFLLLSMGFKLAVPNFSSRCLAIVISDATEGRNPTHDDTFQEYIVLLGISAALFAIFSGLRIWCSAKAEVRIMARLQRILFSSLMTKDLEYFDKEGTGNLTSRLSSDCTLLGSVFTTNVNSVLQSGIILFGALGYMFYLNAELAGIYLAIASLFFVFTKFFGSYVKKLQKQIQNVKASANGVADQAISLIGVVRSFAAEMWENDRYSTWNQEMLYHQLRIKMAYSLYVPAIVGVQNLLLMCVLVVGANMVAKGKMSPSNLATFLFYSQYVQDSMSTLSSQIVGIMTGLGAGAKVFEIIGEPPKMPIRGGRPPTTSSDSTGARLEVRDLAFSYVGTEDKDKKETDPAAKVPRQVLRQVDVTVEPGQRVAIVGLSGSGKSTLMSLIMGFRQPDAGAIRFNGQDIRDLDPYLYRRAVAIVAQDPALFAISIRDNIAYASDSATMSDIEEAAKAACAHDFIMELPNGYDTVVGERGATLSGGQRQRIGISRALLRKPRLLLLDEATSSLDTQSEAAVSRALENIHATQGISMIIVAHRLSTVKSADRILVMSNGSIVEDGTHDQLLVANGPYRALVERQLTSDVIDDVAL